MVFDNERGKGEVMNNEKLNEMASSISTKVLSKYSEIEQANMPSIICEEVSIESIKAVLSLPEVKAMKEALEYYSQGYVFDEPDDDTEQLDIAKNWRHTSGKRARRALADIGEVLGDQP